MGSVAIADERDQKQHLLDAWRSPEGEGMIHDYLHERAHELGVPTVEAREARVTELARKVRDAAGSWHPRMGKREERHYTAVAANALMEELALTDDLGADAESLEGLLADVIDAMEFHPRGKRQVMKLSSNENQVPQFIHSYAPTEEVGVFSAEARRRLRPSILLHDVDEDTRRKAQHMIRKHLPKDLAFFVHPVPQMLTRRDILYAGDVHPLLEAKLRDGTHLTAAEAANLAVTKSLDWGINATTTSRLSATDVFKTLGKLLYGGDRVGRGMPETQIYDLLGPKERVDFDLAYERLFLAGFLGAEAFLARFVPSPEQERLRRGVYAFIADGGYKRISGFNIYPDPFDWRHNHGSFRLIGSKLFPGKETLRKESRRRRESVYSLMTKIVKASEGFFFSPEEIAQHSVAHNYKRMLAYKMLFNEHIDDPLFQFRLALNVRKLCERYAIDTGYRLMRNDARQTRD